MASLQSEIFAIESAIQGELTPNSGDGDAIALDFVNTFTISQSEDALNARADGKNKIALKANKAMTFAVDVEVLNEEAMLMLLGATKDAESGDIVIGTTPNMTYSYTGKAKLIFADGHKEVKDVVIPNCVPQIGADFGTSSLDLQSYTITFDCNVDENGEFLRLKKNVE